MATLARKLEAQGAEVIIAGCTEIPIVLTADDIEGELVSSTDVLVERTIVFAGGELKGLVGFLHPLARGALRLQHFGLRHHLGHFLAAELRFAMTARRGEVEELVRGDEVDGDVEPFGVDQADPVEIFGRSFLREEASGASIRISAYAILASL